MKIQKVSLKDLKATQSLLLVAALSIVMTACGFAGGNQAPVNQGSDFLRSDSGGNNNNNNNGGGSGGGGGTTDPRANNPPPLEFTFEGWGYEDTISFQVQTREHLEVQIQPQAQDQPIRGTSYYFHYSKLAVHIEINADPSTLRPTALLENEMVANPAQKSSVLDYDRYAQQECTTASGLCTYTVTVKRPNYDAWCFSRGLCPPYAPPHTRVRTQRDQNQAIIGDQWRGTIFIGTDETQELN